MHLGAVSHLIHVPPFIKIRSKIANMRFHSNLPGVNELTKPPSQPCRWHGWVITSHSLCRSYLVIHALNWLLVQLVDVNPRGTWINTLRLRQNGRHFADDIFKYIFLNETVWISIKISLKFVHKNPNNNIPALVKITAWPEQATSHYLNQSWLSMLSLLTHTSLDLNELLILVLER